MNDIMNDEAYINSLHKSLDNNRTHITNCETTLTEALALLCIFTAEARMAVPTKLGNAVNAWKLKQLSPADHNLIQVDNDLRDALRVKFPLLTESQFNTVLTNVNTFWAIPPF